MSIKKQGKGRPKHVPQRTCIGCRQVAGKRGLIRVVRTADGVVVDPTGKLAGRGAYIHGTRTCWNRVLEGNRLNQALRTPIKPEDRTALRAFAATLPEDEDGATVGDGEDELRATMGEMD
jgi:predicted RNA-binding protein YlxR (DUF448 family)